MHIAVLFLIFNRPDTTIRVFETIRQAKPPRLYVAADGPRKDKIGEKEKCEEVRSIIKKVDWDCEVKTLFREDNLGCGKAVSQAITWFFDQEEEGIILEDDVLPHSDFFPYCEELLERYKNVEQVRFISGRNHFYGERVNNDSYFFSSINHVWGWAAWRRTWKLYDYDLKNISMRNFAKSLSYYGYCGETVNYWKWIYTLQKKHIINTWDYQMTIALLHNNSLCIIPNSNLIENIGFGDSATHTTLVDLNIQSYKASGILPLQHPEIVALNVIGDAMDIQRANLYLSNFSYFYRRLKMFIKTLVQKMQ